MIWGLLKKTRVEPINSWHLSESEKKDKTNILFIDDNDFKVIEIFKNNGWKNTRKIEDVASLEDQLVRDAHILFVDIHGIGHSMDFSNEGIGLATAIKKKYPEKKLIIYSAEREGDRFDEDIDNADHRIWKNADPIRFINILEECTYEIFSLDGCALRVQKSIQKEAGINLPIETIKEKIIQSSTSENLSERKISEIFNINNIGNAASIISLFMSAIK